MNIKEIRQLDEKSLDKKLEEVKMELIKVNSQISSGQGLKNPGQARVLKKTVARIKTIQTEKQYIAK